MTVPLDRIADLPAEVLQIMARRAAERERRRVKDLEACVAEIEAILELGEPDPGFWEFRLRHYEPWITAPPPCPKPLPFQPLNAVELIDEAVLLAEDPWWDRELAVGWTARSSPRPLLRHGDSRRSGSRREGSVLRTCPRRA